MEKFKHHIILFYACSNYNKLMKLAQSKGIAIYEYIDIYLIWYYDGIVNASD